MLWNTGAAIHCRAGIPAAMYTRDEMKAACTAKGKGWHLMTNAEYMSLAFWCRKKRPFSANGKHEIGL